MKKSNQSRAATAISNTLAIAQRVVAIVRSVFASFQSFQWICSDIAAVVGRSSGFAQPERGLTCVVSALVYIQKSTPFDSLFDLLEVPHLCRGHGRPVKSQARQAALLCTVVVSDENLLLSIFHADNTRNYDMLDRKHDICTKAQAVLPRRKDIVCFYPRMRDNLDAQTRLARTPKFDPA